MMDMRYRMKEWLIDAVLELVKDYGYGYMEDRDGYAMSVTYDTLYGILYGFMQDEVKMMFGNINRSELNEVIDEVIDEVIADINPVDCVGQGKFIYQTLNSNGEACLKKTDDWELAKREYVWGTYGKSGKELLRYVKLMDCETEHLKTILKTQKQISYFTSKAIKDILVQRQTATMFNEDLFKL